MTALPKISRTAFVRQRRSSKKPAILSSQRPVKTSRKSYNHTAGNLPLEKRQVARQGYKQPAKKNHRKGYDIVFTLGRTNVHAPAINIPELGIRWISVSLTAILAFMLFIMWTASPFTVKGAAVIGNQRLGVADINAMLGMIGQPIFKAAPAQIESNLHTAFSDLASIKVHVGLPNRITVNVVERLPVIAWYQNEVVTWIDASGVAFMPRGDVPGLIHVAANASPVNVPLDPAIPIYAQKFIPPGLVQAIIALSRDVPDGMPMAFDPRYGLGWQDPRGWSVYFGQVVKDVPMKKIVYQAIADTLTHQGIQPSLISVEYLNAPFYK